METRKGKENMLVTKRKYNKMLEEKNQEIIKLEKQISLEVGKKEQQLIDLRNEFKDYKTEAEGKIKKLEKDVKICDGLIKEKDNQIVQYEKNRETSRAMVESNSRKRQAEKKETEKKITLLENDLKETKEKLAKKEKECITLQSNLDSAREKIISMSNEKKLEKPTVEDLKQENTPKLEKNKIVGGKNFHKKGNK